MSGFLILFQPETGLGVVVKTTQTEAQPNQYNYFKDGMEAHLTAKNMMDEWLQKRQTDHLCQFRRNREMVS